MRTRSTLLAGATLAAFSLLAGQNAQAADYPVLRGSQFDEPPPREIETPFTWSGFYIGGGAGVSDTKFAPGGTGLQDLARYAFRNTDLGASVDFGSFISDLPTKRDSGATFFGFTGYNFTFGDVVLGVEGDYTRSGHTYSISDFIARRSSTEGTLHNWSMTTNQGAKLHDYATARLRMGWAFGRVMPFATIGGAVGRFDTTSTIDATWRFTRINTVTGALENNVVANGYPRRVGEIKNNVYGYGVTVGGGVDMALTDNLFLRGEYQLIRFADVEGTVTTINTARVAAGLKF